MVCHLIYIPFDDFVRSNPKFLFFFWLLLSTFRSIRYRFLLYSLFFFFFLEKINPNRNWIDEIEFSLFSFFCVSGTNSGVHNDSSCSSGPDSPHTSKDLHLDGSATPTRAQYLSASCVVFTHYSGDTATVVDEHFSRALNFSNKDSKGESNQFIKQNAIHHSFKWTLNWIELNCVPSVHRHILLN